MYKSMQKQIILKNKTIKYDLEYKKVKNINLRIKTDGSVHISANRFVSMKKIEEFIRSKEDFILKAIDKFSLKREEEKRRYFEEDELIDIILNLCKEIYPYFKNLGVKYPQIKFRLMVSQWGNCHFRKGILTFNKYLAFAPLECIEYVVAHEFTHFIHPNHSKDFYNELSKVMPDWKGRREKLKKISIK